MDGKRIREWPHYPWVQARTLLVSFAEVCNSAADRMSSVICEAIHNRVLLQFQYRGRLRVVAPYCHGVSTRGSEVLRAVQVRGSSSSNGFGFGKLWLVDEMEHPLILQETFIPDDPDYNPEDLSMRQIHCRVAR